MLGEVGDAPIANESHLRATGEALLPPSVRVWQKTLPEIPRYLESVGSFTGGEKYD